MTYTFRQAFRIAEGNRIGHEGPELVLREGPAGRVAIKPQTADRAVQQEDRFALRGEGYKTEDEAREDGERWISALALGFVAQLVPADFETRRPQGHFAHSLLNQLNTEATGTAKLYHDQTGLLVVPEDPTPMWGRLEAQSEAIRNAAAMADAVRRAYDEGLRPDERTMLAIDLNSAAENVAGDADARFLMLMFAVEAMIEVKQRSNAQIAVLDELSKHLIGLTDVDPSDRSEVVGALARLRNESIGAAGRRLAASLAPRLYGGRSAVDFFRYAYGIRSKLVHGNVGERRPAVEVVRELHGPMLWFVRDLILARGGANWPHPLDVVAQA
ncbi:hypothetical protein [Lacisediminihabitans sp.]|uniref:hypothetical protein n=1 Tax=Lacisediminihabitans sp. TaxID=2787631 RepID=UPI00374D52EF